MGHFRPFLTKMLILPNFKLKFIHLFKFYSTEMIKDPIWTYTKVAKLPKIMQKLNFLFFTSGELGALCAWSLSTQPSNDFWIFVKTMHIQGLIMVQNDLLSDKILFIKSVFEGNAMFSSFEAISMRIHQNHQWKQALY